MARPVQFDRESVLDKAMLVFWERGYAATSMAKLVEETDLQPGSLYAAFHSKEALFLASLDHYAEQSISRISLALSETGSPLQNIHNYLSDLVTKAAHPQTGHSCLLVNTVLELSAHNAVVRERVNRHLERIESLFRETLENAQARGELNADKNTEDLAVLIMTTIWGLRVLGGTATDSKRARVVVNQLLVALES